MKTLFALCAALCAAILLVACSAPAAQTPGAPTPDQAKPTPVYVAPTPPPAPVVEQQTLDKSNLDGLPKDVADIVAKGAAQSAKGYSYFYQQLENSKIAATDVNSLKVKERGTTRKATPGNQIQVDKTYWIAFTIIDSGAKQATGYCIRRECEGSSTPAPRSLPYAEWSWMGPSDWFNDLRDLTKVGEETINGRTTYKLGATNAGVPITIWIDRFSGLPLQVVRGSTTYSYSNMALGVSEAEVAP